MSAPTVRRGSRPQRTGEPTRRPARTGVHTRGRMHTRALARRGPSRCRADGDAQKSRNAPLRAGAQGSAPAALRPTAPSPRGNKAPGLCFSVCPTPVAPRLALPPAAGADLVSGHPPSHVPVRERKVRGRWRGIGLCAGEVGTLPAPSSPRASQAGARSCRLSLRDKGTSFPLLAKSLPRGKRLCVRRGRGWGSRPAALLEPGLGKPRAALPALHVHFRRTLPKDVFQSCCSPGLDGSAALHLCHGSAAHVRCVRCHCRRWPFPGCPERGRQKGLF